MHVAVTGATGFVGRYVVERLLQEGHEVRGMEHQLTGESVHRDRPRLTWCQGDLEESPGFDELLKDCDALVHAAFNHEPGKFRGGEGGDPGSFWRVNMVGTVQLFESARQHGIKRTVFLSSRAVFGELFVGGELTVPIDDDQTPFPDTHYGMLKAATELLAPLYVDIGLCSIRPTGVYGFAQPIENTKWWSLIRSQGHGSESGVSSKKQRTEVHCEDLARAIEMLLTADGARVVGHSFNCSDIAISEYEIGEIAQRVGQPVAERVFSAKEPSMPPHHPMASRRLRELGWLPGGYAKLVKTIEEIQRSTQANPV